MVKSLSFKKTLLRKYLTTLKTFLLCAFSCVFQENLFVKKLFPHWWLSMVFSSVCVFVSVKKTCLGKLLPHWSCLNGFSPLSIFWCISRKHFWEKNLYPLIIFKWLLPSISFLVLLKRTNLEKLLPKWSNLYGFFPVCVS